MNDNFDDKIHEGQYSNSNHVDFEINPNRQVEKKRNAIVDDLIKRRKMLPGKDYRKTEEQVFDNRTKHVIKKLMNKKILKNLHECISTGKEGNVFIGEKGENTPADWPVEFAVKIYKTCVCQYKDRQRYIQGERRFQNQAKSHNSRQSIILWANKEFRNLKRIHKEGIPCPVPLLVKENIIFMELIMQDDKPAPLLQRSQLQQEDYEKLYIQIMCDMRHIYQKSKLVHSDLSEYNLLTQNKKAIFIDVGQSVETDNVNSSYFLREDISHIKTFFQKVGVKTAPLQESLEFIVLEKLVFDENIVLDEIRKMEEDKSFDEFNDAYIPQRLDQVTDADAEVIEIEDGDYSNAALHGAYTGVITSDLAPYEEEEIYEEEEEESEDIYDNNYHRYEQEEEDSENYEENLEKIAQFQENIQNSISSSNEEQKEENILKKSFNRKNYSNDEWKKIHIKIKAARREKRLAKTSKIDKRKKYRKFHLIM